MLAETSVALPVVAQGHPADMLDDSNPQEMSCLLVESTAVLVFDSFFGQHHAYAKTEAR